MARRSSKGDSTTEAKKGATLVEAISERKLKQLLSASRSSTKDIASLTGTMREKIAYAQEHDHLHTGAYAWIKRLDRMEPDKLAAHMDHFEHMMEISGLNARRAQVLSMSFGAGEQTDADDEQAEEDREEGEETATSDPKVKPFPQRTSVAAE